MTKPVVIDVANDEFDPNLVAQCSKEGAPLMLVNVTHVQFLVPYFTAAALDPELKLDAESTTPLLKLQSSFGTFFRKAVRHLSDAQRPRNYKRGSEQAVAKRKENARIYLDHITKIFEEGYEAVGESPKMMIGWLNENKHKTSQGHEFNPSAFFRVKKLIEQQKETEEE